MVGTTVAVGTLLLMMTGPSMMTMKTRSSNVDGMVVVSSTATQDSSGCAPATGTFSGLSCKDNNGNCAVAGGSWGGYAKIDDFETCYVSQNGYCWSRSQEVDNPIGRRSLFLVEPGAMDHNYNMQPLTFFTRCDPDGYNDGDFGYDNDGIWHVATPLWDGSCGNPCREFF